MLRLARVAGPAAALAAAALVGMAAPAWAGLDSVPDGGLATNGRINALAVSGSTLYLGGTFTEVGRLASGVALLDGRDRQRPAVPERV